MKTLLAAAAAVALCLAPVAMAQGNRGYDNAPPRLDGLSVDQAKAQLVSAGYTKSKNIRFDGKQFDLWENGRVRDACVGFTSYNGRVTEARAFANNECGVVNGGGGPGGFDSSSLRGLRVNDAKRNLEKFGYEHERNIKIDGQQWDLWRSQRGRDCVGFTSYNGTVSGTRNFRRDECEGDWGGNGNGGWGNGGWGNGNGNGGWGGGLRTDNLRGLSVDQAKRALSDAGFQKSRNINIGGQQWDLWYDSRGRNIRCVGFTSYKGQVTDADDFSARDCNY